MIHMKFTMGSPCDNCPFVRSVRFHLRPGMIDEMEAHVGSGFPCHKTTVAGGAPNDKNHIHCAGSLILQWKEFKGFDNMVTFSVSALASKIGWHPDTHLALDADVFDNFEEMREAMEELEA